MEFPEVTDVHSWVEGQLFVEEHTISWPNSLRSGIPPFGQPPTPQYETDGIKSENNFETRVPGVFKSFVSGEPFQFSYHTTYMIHSHRE